MGAFVFLMAYAETGNLEIDVFNKYNKSIIFYLSLEVRR